MSGACKSLGQIDRIQKYRLSPKFLILPLLFLFFTTLVSGQTIQEFKEIWVKESREYLRNNQMPLPYLQSGFHYFSREQDNVLTAGLELDWEKFTAHPGIPVPKSRKFETTPVFSFDETSNHNPQFLPCYQEDKNDDLNGVSSLNLPRIRKPDYTSLNPQKLIFKFYGNNIAVSYDRILSLPVNQPINNEVVIEFWKKFLVANSHHLVNQLMSYRDRLGLNDWGYFLLAKYCCSAIYPSDEAGETLLAWALMIRSGYDVKIGYNQLGGTILYTTASKIYGAPSVNINGLEYYIDKSISSFPISTYLPNHPGAAGTIHLKLNQSLNFQGDIQYKKIQFQWDNKSYDFNLKYNPEVIRFLEEYPNSDTEVYYGAPFSYLSGESLLRQFSPVLTGMKNVEAAAFLQQFVQKAFTYRPYNDLYGYDKFMFPEELLFKDESNDKGKSLLFAWMVNNLLNLRVALIEYPGFYSVGISFNQPMDGDNFLIDRRSYTIADPTFENAPIGLVMREFYSIKPLIKPLNDLIETEKHKEKIWKIATAFGAERSGCNNDFLIDENGNSYITGYFKEKIKANTLIVPEPFVARFDEDNKLVWMEKFTSSGGAFGLELRQLDRNEFYLAGSFRGELECNGSKIRSEKSNPDLFFAQFNKNGEIGWMTKSGLDDLEEDARLFYVVRFARSGEIQSVQLANEDERSDGTGFQKSTNEGLCYIASRFQTSGMEKSSEEIIKKSPIRLRQNFNRMKLMGIEKSTAGLASIFRSLINRGDQLSGDDLASFNLENLKTGNEDHRDLTDLIQKIKLIKNEDGIVKISTNDSKATKILSFRISDQARFKIIPLDNNDLKIKIIDGIRYESGMINEKIKSFLVDLSTGNLIIEIGANHQILTKNLKLELRK